MKKSMFFNEIKESLILQSIRNNKLFISKCVTTTVKQQIWNTRTGRF